MLLNSISRLDNHLYLLKLSDSEIARVMVFSKVDACIPFEIATSLFNMISLERFEKLLRGEKQYIKLFCISEKKTSPINPLLWSNFFYKKREHPPCFEIKPCSKTRKRALKIPCNIQAPFEDLAFTFNSYRLIDLPENMAKVLFQKKIS